MNQNDRTARGPAATWSRSIRVKLRALPHLGRIAKNQRVNRFAVARTKACPAKTNFNSVMDLLKMVGAIGFEPTTYGTQNRRATRLRYAPTFQRSIHCCIEHMGLLAKAFGIEKPYCASQAHEAEFCLNPGCRSTAPALIFKRLAKPPLISRTASTSFPPSIPVSSCGIAFAWT